MVPLHCERCGKQQRLRLLWSLCRSAHLHCLIRVSGVVTRRTGVFPQLQQVRGTQEAAIRWTVPLIDFVKTSACI